MLRSQLGFFGVVVFGALLVLNLVLAFTTTEKLFPDGVLLALPAATILGFAILFLIKQPFQIALLALPFLFLRTREDFFVIAAMVLLAIAWMATVARTEHVRKPGIGDQLVLYTILLLGLYAFTQSIHERRIYMLLGEFVAPVGLFFAIHTMRANRSYFIKYLKLLLLIYALIGIGSVVSKVLDPSLSRVAGYPSMSVTMFGYTGAALIPLAMEFVHREKNKLLWQATLVLLLVLILLTNSRMAFGIAIPGIILQSRRIKDSIWVFALVGLATVILGAELIFTRFTDEASTIDISNAARLTAYWGCFRIIEAHPLFGVGLGGFTMLYTKLILFPVSHLVHAHNVVLNKAAEIGIPGMILYLGFILRKVYSGFRMSSLSFSGFIQGSYLKDPLVYALTCTLSVYLLVGAIESLFFFGQWVIWFWILLAVLTRLNTDCKVSDSSASCDKGLGQSSSFALPCYPKKNPLPSCVHSSSSSLQ